MAEEEVAAAAVSPVSSDHKRKLDDSEPKEGPEPAVSSPPPSETLADSNANAIGNEVDNTIHQVKRPRLEEEITDDGSAVKNGHQVHKLDVPPMENAQHSTMGNLQMENAQHPSEEKFQMGDAEDPSVENPQRVNAQQPSVENGQTVNTQNSSGEDLQRPTEGIPQQGDLSSMQQQPMLEPQTMSRKMEVPNNKVGVLIGKAGDTIRFLQYNSGVKIQITRDADTDPYSSTRPVELIGTLENINKAEKLIKDVITEADAGGSPSLVARGFGTAQAGGVAEQIQIQVPNEKVGLMIGKGGETIKNLQMKSGARIQLILQHLPEGDQSKERTVRVTGNKKQIEMAREMIKEVMNQTVRPSPLSGGYNQQTYRPRGPTAPPQWGSHAPPPAQATGYDYQQRGMHPSQKSQYPPPTYGGYAPQQPAPRSNFNAGGWDQRPSGPTQAPLPQSGGNDFYGQGSHVANAPAPASVSNPVSAPAFGALPTQVNYNYGQPQGPEYGQPTTYLQSAPPQQSYGHGYGDPKYENQVPIQHAYGGHGNSQPGVYPQQISMQPGYAQQPYTTKPPNYGMPSQGPPQTYGLPKTSQPGDVPYQGPVSSTHSYGSAPYGHASSGSTQHTYPYGSAPAANDGYNQPPSLTASAHGYPQQGGQSVSGYVQPGGQPTPGYTQGGQSGGYGPYSSSQVGYSEQPVSNNVSYGSQGPANAGYNSAPTSAYVAPSGQAGYVQPTSNPASYEQSMPQSGGYGGVPGNAPVGYGNLSPQPVYGQYDSTQMYVGHHQ